MEKIYLSRDMKKIINKIDFSRLGEKVAIKVHFGEKGCKTYINPDLVRAVYDKVISLGKKAVLVECNVLYRGSRTNSTDHIKTAREHGFDMPIDILDGEMGDDFIEVELGKGLLKNIKLGKGLKNYDSMIVMSHFKGHEIAGFGGAFKNLGMGLGSRAGKLHMHSDIKPSVSDRCIGCSVCVENCNANAIKIINNKASINQEKCEGCAMCIAVCPQKAMKVPWHATTSEQLQKKIIDYTEGVMKIIPKEKMIFINVLEDITENCDCMSIEQIPIMKDIGILLGDDIVAIDKASLDLVKRFFSGKTQIDYAAEKDLGKKNYEIINLDD